MEEYIPSSFSCTNAKKNLGVLAYTCSKAGLFNYNFQRATLTSQRDLAGKIFFEGWY